MACTEFPRLRVFPQNGGDALVKKLTAAKC